MESTYQNPETILQIKLSKIIISQNNVRKNLKAGNEDSSIEDLAKSIDKNGLINPITVKQVNGDYEVIIGQRRFYACQLLGWVTIPAQITCVDDIQAQILSLIENVHRADLHPLDKGTAYQQLYNNFGTYASVSRETGVSVSTVKRYLMLLKLSPNIQLLLTTGDGPAGICTLSLLAELFSEFDNQEYVLERIGRFKQQVQLEILKLSKGEIGKIDALVLQALGGYFSVYVCKGLKTCPYIPDECRDEVMQLIYNYTSTQPQLRIVYDSPN
jgi:ParB family chromosome partitioning protein